MLFNVVEVVADNGPVSFMFVVVEMTLTEDVENSRSGCSIGVVVVVVRVVVVLGVVVVVVVVVVGDVVVLVVVVILDE